MKHFLLTIKTRDDESLPSASYVVDQNAMIMITRLAEQAQAGILKALILEKCEVTK